MRRVVVVQLFLTGGEQAENTRDDLKRDITKGLQKGHGLDKGIAIAGTCKFFDFETCEEIVLRVMSSVRCIAC